MGDIAKANREMTWVKSAIEGRRWDQAEGQANSVEQALQGLSDEEKAPLAAELAALREQCAAGRKGEKAKRIVDEINRKIEYATATNTGPAQAKSVLQEALERLEERDAQQYLDAEVISALRARITGTNSSTASEEKNKLIQKIEQPLKQLEQLFAQNPNPFKGKNFDEVRGGLEPEIAGGIRSAQSHLKDMSPSDADGQALAARLAKMEKAYAATLAEWLEDHVVGKLRQSWNMTEESFAGWEDEKQGPSWEVFVEGSARGSENLHMLKTMNVIRECTHWLRNTADEQKEFGHVDGVKSLVTEATETLEKAAKKVHNAFERLIDEAERASLPTSRRDLEKPQRVSSSVARWFEMTPYQEANVARANALCAKWEATLEKLDRDGRELYKKLEAEAAVDWPEILKTIKFESGFDPKEVASWKNKTVLLTGLYNRSGWDFTGTHWAARVNDVPVAGNFEQKITMAMEDISRRTRQPIDDHQEWQVVGVIEGPGTIKKRVHHEMTVKGTNEKIKTESWDPVDCVMIRIIALHAGPVAVGPR
jgi:hypothetical protein